MTPVQAGWRTIDEPTTGPAPCAGSGQIVNPWSPLAGPCPVCGRLVRIDAARATDWPHDLIQTVPTHLPPAEPAPTLSLWETVR